MILCPAPCPTCDARTIDHVDVVEHKTTRIVTACSGCGKVDEYDLRRFTQLLDQPRSTMWAFLVLVDAFAALCRESDQRPPSAADDCTFVDTALRELIDSGFVAQRMPHWQPFRDDAQRPPEIEELVELNAGVVAREAEKDAAAARQEAERMALYERFPTGIARVAMAYFDRPTHESSARLCNAIRVEADRFPALVSVADFVGQHNPASWLTLTLRIAREPEEREALQPLLARLIGDVPATKVDAVLAAQLDNEDRSQRMFLLEVAAEHGGPECVVAAQELTGGFARSRAEKDAALRTLAAIHERLSIAPGGAITLADEPEDGGQLGLAE